MKDKIKEELREYNEFKVRRSVDKRIFLIITLLALVVGFFLIKPMFMGNQERINETKTVVIIKE